MTAQDGVSAEAENQPLRGWRGALRDLFQMIRFYSRLPAPKLPFEADAYALPDFRSAPRMLPIASLLIAVPSALMLLVASALALPETIAAALAVAMMALSTGGFHEDGLADTFDGLGGGATVERRLEIMKDSRIGSFGGAALMLALILRVFCLAAILEQAGTAGTAAALLATAALSRTLGLVPLALLPPARPGGFSSAVGRPTLPTLMVALAFSLAFAGAAGAMLELSPVDTALACLVSAVPAGLMSWWSLRAIRGQTGDIAGATQQLSEIAFGVGLLISLSP
jgi:adenosylcobinamide-GDP ribazoletransferase